MQPPPEGESRPVPEPTQRREEASPPPSPRRVPPLITGRESSRTGTEVESQSESRVYVDDNYYIPVDDEGYCVGRYWEGALGCVVRLLSARQDYGNTDDNRDSDFRVVKIPRLRADTLAENGYVDHLNEMEVASARRFGGKSHLLGYWADHPLRGKRILQQANDRRAAQRDQIVLVRFEKGRAPRFVSVGRDSDPVPTGAARDLPGKGDIDKLLEIMRSVPAELLGTHFVARGKPAGEQGPRRLSQALQPTDDPEPWFCFPPSIVYHWATTNLQEAMCEGTRGEWSLSQHLRLTLRILDAVDFLHRHGCLHADLRPANVMVTGEKGATSPDSYELGDYGSLSERQPVEDQHRGDTMVGARVGSERASPFYSPERRMAIERESADTALVLGRPGNGDVSACLLILLGWQKSLVSSNIPNPALLEAMRSVDIDKIEPVHGDAGQSDSPDRESLQYGDRVRLRDHVFTVRSEGRLEGCRVLICDPQVSRTMHGHLVLSIDGAEEVPVDRGDATRWESLATHGSEGGRSQGDEGFPFLEPAVLRLPSVVELQKWGAAVDLYGIGALALYSVYCEAFQTAEERRDALGEFGFGEMILLLESRAFFHANWRELDDICRELHDKAMKCADGVSVELDEEELDNIREVTNSLTRGVPNLWWIWFSIGKKGPSNLAGKPSWPHFLLFVHFVMGCLHRLSHIKGGDGKTSAKPPRSDYPLGPFCEDRLEAPRADGAAHAALSRLRQLLGHVERGSFGRIVVEGEPDKYRAVHDNLRKLGREVSQKDEALKKMCNWREDILQVLQPLTTLSQKELKAEIAKILPRLGPLISKPVLDE